MMEEGQSSAQPLQADGETQNQLQRPKSTKFSSVARSVMMMKRIHGDVKAENMPSPRALASALKGNMKTSASNKKISVNDYLAMYPSKRRQSVQHRAGSTTSGR